MPFLDRLTGLCAVFCLTANSLCAAPDYFVPTNRLAGIGADRASITPAVLDERTGRMIQAQTFAIMRDPNATAGAARINAPAMRRIFDKAAAQSSWPASTLAAMAYLESFGDPYAQSPAGPKGIMQFSEATARAAGLRIVRATRFRVTTERKLVRSGKRRVYRTVRRRRPYSVTVRDDRLVPSRAVPAAANYLARMETKFGGRDWAIFAFHCGEGCVSDLLALTQEALGGRMKPTVAAMFFAANPALHRELYEAVERHMQRDFSPTYWFRVMRAEELLNLYQTDRAAFGELAEQYRNPVNPERRANDRLVVWLKSEDLFYRSADDLKGATGKSLEKLLDDPTLFGFDFASPDKDSPVRNLYLQGSPAAIGTLLYVAFETRRLFDELKPKAEHWVPLRVVEFVTTMDHPAEAGTTDVDPEFPEHATGHVFDIDRSNLPAGERESLDFILDDLGWNAYLGFVDVTGDTVHVGCAPSVREFFATVFAEATLAHK